MMITQAKKKKADSLYHSSAMSSHFQHIISQAHENVTSMASPQPQPVPSFTTHPNDAFFPPVTYSLPLRNSMITTPNDIGHGVVSAPSGLIMPSSVNSYLPVTTNVHQAMIPIPTISMSPHLNLTLFQPTMLMSHPNDIMSFHPATSTNDQRVSHPDVVTSSHQATCTDHQANDNPIVKQEEDDYEYKYDDKMPLKPSSMQPTMTESCPDHVTSIHQASSTDDQANGTPIIKQEEDGYQYDTAVDQLSLQPNVPIKQEEDEDEYNNQWSKYNNISNQQVESDALDEKSLLPMNIIKSEILQYLDPRTLLNVSYTCKELNDAVTVPMAVTSAMMIGGHSLTSMTVLYELMKKASIYPPKAKRILLISVGRKCELCKDKTVSHLRRGHGVFACWDCVRNRYTECIAKKGDLFESNPIACNRVLSHPRVARRLSEWRHVQEHIQEESELAKAGGILHHVIDEDGTSVHLHGSLAVKDMQNFIWTKRLTDTEGDGVGPILLKDMLLALCQEAAMTSPTDRCLIDEKLTALGAPSASDNHYKDFVRTYEANISIALDKKQMRLEQRQMAMDRYVRVRIETARRFVSNLKEVIDDPKLASLLNYRENTNFHNPYLRVKHNQRPIKMCVYWVDKMLRKHLKCPSEIPHAGIKHIALQMKDAYKVKRSKEDLARLSWNRKTLLKWFYVDSDEKTYYYCHD